MGDASLMLTRVLNMAPSRDQLEAMVEVIDLAIRPIRLFQGEEVMRVAISRMRADALKAAAMKDRCWLTGRIDQVLAKHGLRCDVVH